ncbi:MAG: amidohydrolase [Methanobacteriota archaeon]|nr:MAG: amidohydrolase [Euryarchaeota archaeon]
MATGLEFMSLRKEAKEIKPKLVEIRRQIHMYPEPGFEEHKTSKFIQEKLRELGLEPKVWAKTGITAVIEGGQGKGKTVLLRADIDALPVQEANDVPYKSRNEGFSHACGHDAHVACLLGAAELLLKHKDEFRGKVLLVFQPAEEGPGGAKPMIEEGAIGSPENPDIDAAMALHITAMADVGLIGVTDGLLTASADEFYVTIKGKGGHGSAPHMAIDPIYIAGQIITGIQGFITRTVDPVEHVVFTWGKVIGGERQNVISETCRLEGTLRTHNREVRSKLKEELPKFIQSVAKTYGGNAEVEVITGYDVGINDKKLNDSIRRAVKKHYSEDVIIDRGPIMGAEDFFEFALGGKIPTSMFWLFAGNKEKGFTHGNHSNYFDFDEDALPIGTTILAQAAIDYLNNEE